MIELNERFPIPPMEDVALADVLRALADPVRLHVVALIADGREHSKTYEDWHVDVGKATLAYHFKVLRESGLTTTVIDGRRHRIRLRRTELDGRFPGLIEAVVAAAR